MRELAPPESLLKLRDEAPLIVVPPSTWHCLFCDPNGPIGAQTTVAWLGPNTDGPHGRCRDCGQKYELSDNFNMKLREALQAENVEVRIYFCSYWPVKTDPQKGINTKWNNAKGHCEDCGQNYNHRPNTLR